MSARSRPRRSCGRSRRRRPRRPVDRPSRSRARRARTLHQGTYADADALASLLESERIEAILHCAARSLVGESIADPSKYYRDNVAGGVALLEAARAAQVERLVFSSTAAVYGIPDVTPIPEDAPLRPINPYGESKRTFEAALAWYGRAYGLRSVTLRYFNVAGATEALGEDHDPETHLIPNVLARRRGQTRASRSSATTTRPPTGPASATTSTSPTSPTRTCGRSRRPRPATRGRTTRSSATWGTAAASRSARSSPPPRPWSGARSRPPSGRVGRAIRRSSSRAPTARRRSSAGARRTRASRRSSARPGPGAWNTRTATGTDPGTEGPLALPV